VYTTEKGGLDEGGVVGCHLQDNRSLRVKYFAPMPSEANLLFFKLYFTITVITRRRQMFSLDVNSRKQRSIQLDYHRRDFFLTKQ
jgi:hypothetical protein